MAKRKWPASFDLQIRNGYYYEVYIFGTLPALRRFSAECKATPTPDMTAQCIRFEAVIKKRFGALLFTKSNVTDVGCVSHELFHAVSLWWEKMNKPPKDFYLTRFQEDFARLLETTTYEFWGNIQAGYKSGFLTPQKDAVGVRA